MTGFSSADTYLSPKILNCCLQVPNHHSPEDLDTEGIARLPACSSLTTVCAIVCAPAVKAIRSLLQLHFDCFWLRPTRSPQDRRQARRQPSFPGKHSILTTLLPHKHTTTAPNLAIDMAASRRKPIHQQPKLCDHILSHAAKSDVSLRISESSIPNAGSGLFAVNDIPAGSEIFHTNPLITVAESAHQGICDFCFLNSGSSVNRNGRFYGLAEDDVRPEITRCGACMVARYCSKVSAVKFSGSHLLIMSSCVTRNVRSRRGRATTNTNAAFYKRTQP